MSVKYFQKTGLPEMEIEGAIRQGTSNPHVSEHAKTERQKLYDHLQGSASIILRAHSSHLCQPRSFTML